MRPIPHVAPAFQGDNREDTMNALTCQSVFGALAQLERQHPLPPGLDAKVTSFAQDIGRHGSLSAELLAQYRSQFVSFIPVADDIPPPENLLSTASRVLWTKILELKVLMQNLPDSDQKSKFINHEKRLIEIYKSFFQETIRQFLKRQSFVLQAEEAEQFATDAENLFFRESPELDRGDFYNPLTRKKVDCFKQLHEVFNLLMDVLPIQKYFQSTSADRLHKFYLLIQECLSEYNSYGNKICNVGVRNKLVTGILHRDYDGMYFISKYLTEDLKALTSEFYSELLMNIERDNPRLSFKIVCQWVGHAPEGDAEFDRFLQCRNELKDFLSQRLKGMGLDPEEPKSQLKTELERFTAEGENAAYQNVDCPQPQAIEKPLRHLNRLLFERDAHGGSFLRVFGKLQSLSDIKTQFDEITAYCDLRDLYAKAKKTQKSFGFDLPNGVVFGKEEQSLKVCIEKILRELSLILDTAENWHVHAEISQQLSEELRNLQTLINIKNHIEELLGNSFAHYAMTENASEKKNIIARVKALFNEHHLFMDNDHVLENWYEARVRPEEGVRELEPHHINRICWQALLTSPLKWSTRFQEIFEEILGQMEKPAEGDRLHEAVIKSSYHPDLLAQLKQLLRIAKKPVAVLRPSVFFISCALEGLELVDTIEDLEQFLKKREPSQRLNLIREIELPKNFINRKLLESPVLKEIPKSDWLDAMDYLLSTTTLSSDDCREVFINVFKPPITTNRKIKKDIADKALRKSSERNMNPINSIFLLILNGTLPFNYAEFMGCFDPEDRIEALKQGSQLLFNFSFDVLLYLPQKDWPTAFEGKIGWRVFFAANDFITFLTLLSTHKENLFPHFFKQLANDPTAQPGERIKVIFSQLESAISRYGLPLSRVKMIDAKKNPVLLCLQTFSIDLYLPFLEALAPYFNFAFNSERPLGQYLDIYNEVLPNLNSNDRNTFIAFAAKNMRSSEGVASHTLYQFLIPLDEIECVQFLKSCQHWLSKENKHSYLGLLKHFHVAQWTDLNDIFKWDHEKEKLLTEIFVLPSGLWERAFQFFKITKESARETSNLAKILLLYRVDWNQLQGFLTEADRPGSLFLSAEDLLKLLDDMLSKKNLHKWEYFHKDGSNLCSVVLSLLKSMDNHLFNILKTTQNYFKLLELAHKISFVDKQATIIDVYSHVLGFLRVFILNREDYYFAIAWLASHGALHNSKFTIQELQTNSHYQQYRTRDQYGKILKGLIAEAASVEAFMPLIAQGFKEFTPTTEPTPPNFLVSLYDDVGPQYIVKALETLALGITQPPEYPLKINAEIQNLIDQRGCQDQALLNSIVLSCFRFLRLNCNSSDFDKAKKFYKGDEQAWQILILTTYIEIFNHKNDVSYIYGLLNDYYLKKTDLEFTVFLRLLLEKFPPSNFIYLMNFNTIPELQNRLIQEFLGKISDKDVLREFYREISYVDIVSAIGYLSYLKHLDNRPDLLRLSDKHTAHLCALKFSTRDVKGKIRLISLNELVETFKCVRRDRRNDFLKNLLKQEINFLELSADIDSFSEWMLLAVDDAGHALLSPTPIEPLLCKHITSYEEYKKLRKELFMTMIWVDGGFKRPEEVLNYLGHLFHARDEFFRDFSQITDYVAGLFDTAYAYTGIKFMQRWSSARLMSLCDLSKCMNAEEKKNLALSMSFINRHRSKFEDSIMFFFQRVVLLNKDLSQASPFITYQAAWNEGENILDSLKSLLKFSENAPTAMTMFGSSRDTEAQSIIQNMPSDGDPKVVIEYLGSELAKAERDNPVGEMALRLHWAISAISHPESFKTKPEPENDSAPNSNNALSNGL